MTREKGGFGRLAAAIGEAGGEVSQVETSRAHECTGLYELTIDVTRAEDVDRIETAVRALAGVRMLEVYDETFRMHLGGKLETLPKIVVRDRDDLAKVYTPGVARVCMAIHEEPERAHSLTIKRNTVAVVSDGSAVLGLGNIGPLAAMPVMEGKAMLFKQLGGVDAFPICLDTQDTEEIIKAVKQLAPAFGGINLEDISAPRCFEIERRLVEELDIPVFHDDQHGTAVVMLAGILNAVKLVGKELSACKVIVSGVGAAGTACTNILLSAGVTRIIGVDRQGALVRSRSYANEAWNLYASRTNPELEEGTLSEVIAGADIFVGVSAPGLLKREDVSRMAKDAIVFAMANPNPEITPEEADGYVRVMATGRSDYPNQINNVLCFPGLFRGVLDCRAERVTEGMKLAAARAIAASVSDEELSETCIIPSAFNASVAEKVRQAVLYAAYEEGIARRRSQVD
ncbi:NAD-dependent malic enzyme [Gorillibacterium sp. CAU 1737]|uniref:NAD-dependent malic enzyme n=1 Tax=Gorillibacterium sp. CAU 1737 TaxID=3140362 RepID=UPI003261CDA9